VPHDPIRVADTRCWLEKARFDLDAGDADLAYTPPICGDAMFHAQQAVEKALTPYAWIFRYPGESEEPSRDEAEQALAIAREAYEAVLSRLPSEARP